MFEATIVWIPIVIAAIAVVFDLRSREIPDSLPIVLVLLAFLQFALPVASSTWWSHLLGGLLALIAGAVLAHRDGFGGGDVKLFAALGCWFGIGGVFPLALWIALAGLPLAVIAAARKQVDFAYAPAILIGVCVHSYAPHLLHQLATWWST
ncbi:MAG: prepilin peptidase [Gammaproteobacteria bacterium]|nr:prepilin peptidase [Gammaproteobacteria bacterium]